MCERNIGWHRTGTFHTVEGSQATEPQPTGQVPLPLQRCNLTDVKVTKDVGNWVTLTANLVSSTIAFITSPWVISKCIKFCLQGSDILLEKMIELMYLNMNLNINKRVRARKCKTEWYVSSEEGMLHTTYMSSTMSRPGRSKSSQLSLGIWAWQ